MEYPEREVSYSSTAAKYAFTPANSIIKILLYGMTNHNQPAQCQRPDAGKTRR